MRIILITMHFPQREQIIVCLEKLWFLLFPDHFSFLGATHASPSKKKTVESTLRKTLSTEAKKALESLQQSQNTVDSADSFCDTPTSFSLSEFVEQKISWFLDQIPYLRERLFLDAKRAFDRDPAAESPDSVILSYPGFLALMSYRLAHSLVSCGIPLIPRMMSERAHSQTGCDIHPEAKIGSELFIDHATGVVIGQTSVIGDRVTIYQGVTLGSLSVQHREISKQRHPTIEEDVVLYAHATILGGTTVVGARSVIGGSCWITSSVPPDSKVIAANPQSIVTRSRKQIQYIPNWDI